MALGDVLDSFASPGGTPQGLAWDGTNLWHCDSDTDLIYKLNPSNGSVLDSFASPGTSPTGLTYDGTNLWNSDFSDNTIYKLDPSDGSVIDSFASPGGSPRGLAWDGTSLWHTDNSTNTIYKLDPSDGSTLDSFAIPGTRPIGLAYDGTSLWHSDNITDTIYKLSLNTAPTANAGNDQSVDEGTTVNLDGTGSTDPEDAPSGDSTGALLGYEWTVADADGTGLVDGDITGRLTATPSFTAPEVSGPDAQIVIQLEVTDSAGGTDTDTVTITVADTTLVVKTGAGGLVLGGQAEVEFQSFMLLRHTGHGGLALGGAAESSFRSFVRVRHTGTGGIAVSGSARAHKTHHVEHFLPGTLSGDHSIIGEARVVTGFQSGHDPEGTQLTISGGDITYAATAKIFATLSLDLPGVDDNGGGLFPAHPSDLLAPYGNEVFARVGIHLGSHIQWFPMGYFRINTDEQDEAAYGPIGISLQDRMAGIIEARLLRPKAYPLGTLVGSAVDDLVKEVYPDAQIEFDDDSDEAALGRQFIVEKDRYGGLKDIADHLGKIVFWNEAGVLRFQDQPAPGEIAWEVNAGQDGVLVEAGRRVTREGVYNAVVARGEGADTNEPVEGIAADGNVDSPTYFFGVNSSGKVFGKVPRFYSSPLLTTNGQCEQAATTILRRLLGTPYSVDFGSVTNPSLRPYQNVRIRHSDESTENHIIDRLRIPLTAGRNMSGKTREQTLQQVVIV